MHFFWMAVACVHCREDVAVTSGGQIPRVEKVVWVMVVVSSEVEEECGWVIHLFRKCFGALLILIKL